MDLDEKKPLYSIGVVEDILGIPQRVLRFYEERGVIKPSRTDTNRRLYSKRDLEKIEYVHFLTHIKRVNLAGVKEIFGLLDKLKETEREALFIQMRTELESLSEEKKRLLKESEPPVAAVFLPEENNRQGA